MTIDATQRFARLSAFVVVTLAAASACAMACSSTSSGGTTAQGDGGGASASASGQTCAWDEAKSRAAGLPIVSGPPGGYHVGDVLQSPDGCNGCGCTTQGFECTQNTCPPSRADAFDDSTCPADTSTCPDGTVMRRTTVACVFTRCPSAGSACTAELKNCPDGGTTGRSGPYCTYQYGSCN